VRSAYRNETASLSFDIKLAYYVGRIVPIFCVSRMNFVNMQSQMVMHYILERSLGQPYEVVNCNLQ
jgi:hypothetical protein